MHWIERARAALRAEYDVYIALPNGDRIDEIKQSGFKVLLIDISRNGLNPFREIVSFIGLYGLVSKLSPHLIVNVTVKPNFYGSIIGRHLNIPVVNNVTGLGSIFSRRSFPNFMLKNFILTGFRILTSHQKIIFIFENSDDLDLFVENKIAQKGQSYLMPGAGVDTKKYCSKGDMENDKCIILFAARLLWDKGIHTLIEASEILAMKELNFEIVVAGITDNGNTNSVPEEYLIDWEKRGLIKWLGKRDDMSHLISSVDIATLPTYYGEGIPRFIIEAASCGKPVVTSDISGCRDFVENEKNGILVKPRDAKKLAHALERLINDKHLRTKMGQRGREKVCRFFSEDIVIDKTLQIYGDMAGI